MSKMNALFDVNGSFGKQCSGGADFPTIKERLEFMDRFGINRALVWNTEALQDHSGSCNNRLIEEIRKTPGAEGRIIPALVVSGLTPYERDGIETLARQMKAARTRALRFTNVFGRLTLCQLEPVIRKIRGMKPFIVMRHDHSNVADILEFTEMFPDIPLVLTEVMWGPASSCSDLMRRRRNILVDNSWLHSCGAIEVVVRHFGAERLVFGTGLRAQNGAAIGALARADITEAQRKLIAFGNVDRLTGMKTGGMSSKPKYSKGNTLWARFLEGKAAGCGYCGRSRASGPVGRLRDAGPERAGSACLGAEDHGCSRRQDDDDFRPSSVAGCAARRKRPARIPAPAPTRVGSRVISLQPVLCRRTDAAVGPLFRRFRLRGVQDALRLLARADHRQALRADVGLWPTGTTCRCCRTPGRDRTIPPECWRIS